MKSICVMRELYKAIDAYEKEFERVYEVCLNEAMALCSLSHDETELTATEIAEKTGMTTSHTSKVIKNIENKELIHRSLGKEDKRQMYFTLTDKGRERLQQISCRELEIPEILKPVFEKLCSSEK
ncbi:MAG: MarR family transcriptional regulator [Bacteroidales bacterium]